MESAPGRLTVERLMRAAAGMLEVPIAVCFAIEGENARCVASASDAARDAGIDEVVPSRRLRVERTRVVPHVGRGPAAPEVALFAPGTMPLAIATVPIFGEHDEQIATLLFADLRPRPDLSERRVLAIDELCPLIASALASLVAPAHEVAAPGSASASAPRRRNSSSQHAPRADAVTGLPDRAYVHHETDRRIERAGALTHGIALAIVSLDRFRRVNDSLGHALGDALLRQVAQRLLSSVDEGDVVGRRGGDEFIVVLDDIPSGSSPLPRVDRLHQAMREPFHVGGNEIMLTACIGISRHPEDASESTTLLRYADIALHQAKNEGPARVKVFDASMQQTARERLDLEHQLREAMRSGQLSMHYQPKYAIPSRKIVGAEALLRWNHPRRGMISPGRFIPVAEESGLIVPIGTWALNEVCRQTKRWLTSGLEVGRVSVNVSGLQFTRHDFVGTVTRAMRSASLPPTSLEVELTETIVMGDVESAIGRLGQLRALGVRVSIDDFGTGYSSLAYLQKLPVDVLKIDRSFVQELDREGMPAQQARSLAQAITYLGHQLGLDVLAEGVETEAQLDQLTNVGCDEVQGYLLGRPMAADAFERHLIGD